jgi:hypothetical protein
MVPSRKKKFMEEISKIVIGGTREPERRDQFESLCGRRERSIAAVIMLEGGGMVARMVSN